MAKNTQKLMIFYVKNQGAPSYGMAPLLKNLQCTMDL